MTYPNDSFEIYLRNPDLLIKKYFHNHKFCMAYNKPACSGEISKSHTLSKKYLRNISTNGHIYVPTSSSHNKQNLYEFQLKGINETTRIPGFCKYHDNKLFESFEKDNFTGDYEQIYYLSFRSLCREYFKKKCLLDFFSHEILKKINQNEFLDSRLFKNFTSHLNKEIRDHKFIYDQMKKYNNSGLNYILIELDRLLPVAATGVLFPLMDSTEKKIQNEHKKQLGFIYTIISEKYCSYIIVSTVRTLSNNIHKEFLDSLIKMSPDQLINYLLSCFFYNNDNIVLKPDWFETLAPDFKNKLDKLMNHKVGWYSTCTISPILNFTSVFGYKNHDCKLNLKYVIA